MQTGRCCQGASIESKFPDMNFAKGVGSGWGQKIFGLLGMVKIAHHKITQKIKYIYNTSIKF